MAINKYLDKEIAEDDKTMYSAISKELEKNIHFLKENYKANKEFENKKFDNIVQINRNDSESNDEKTRNIIINEVFPIIKLQNLKVVISQNNFLNTNNENMSEKLIDNAQEQIVENTEDRTVENTQENRQELIAQNFEEELSVNEEESSEFTEIINIPKYPLGQNFLPVNNFVENCRKIKINNFILYKNDLRRLFPGGWLNDAIINTYLDLLNKENKNIYCFDTFFFNTISKYGTDKFYEWIVNDGRLEKLYTSKFLFFPYHSGAHWCLFKFDGRTIFGYDSLGNAPGKGFKMVLYFLRKVFSSRQINAKRGWKVPKQNNGDDCGVFTCMYAKYYAYKIEMFESNEIPILRQQMLHEILLGKIIYKD